MAERIQTPRGFSKWIIENRDYRTTPPYEISVQASSLATERRVWLGPSKENRMHLSEDAAREVRDALTEWLNEAPETKENEHG